MRTGRPRGFCVEETLDRAMTVFWRHGYEGASMSDLTAAMGINSPSLYACFGSKEGLFRAVLERYDERRKSFMESVLAAPTAAKVAETYLAWRRGFCDRHQRQESARLPVVAERTFLRRFRHSRRDGASSRRKGSRPVRSLRAARRSKATCRKAANPAALARYLMTVSNGICVQAASGASAEELHEVAAIALTSWPAGKSVKATKARKKAVAET